jgi:hypothetical protein
MFPGRDKPAENSTGWVKKLFFPEIFDLVSDKRSQDEDDQKDDDIDKDTEYTQETNINAQTPGDNVLPGENEDNPQQEAGDRAIFQEAGVVFFPMVIKAKDNTQDQVQQFKPHTDALSLVAVLLPLFKKVSGAFVRQQWLNCCANGDADGLTKRRFIPHAKKEEGRFCL